MDVQHTYSIECLAMLLCVVYFIMSQSCLSVTKSKDWCDIVVL